MVSRVIPVDPFDLVIFGGTGDLARRKILPGLFRRFCAGQMPVDARIIGAARGDIGRDGYQDMIREAINEFGAPSAESQLHLDAFIAQLHYVAVDICGDGGWDELAKLIRKDLVNAYYFSVAPSLFGDIAARLNSWNIATPEARIVVEKPFGRDLQSAKALNKVLSQQFDESQIYRIDHYLGKETVQNLMALRFANTIFESQWGNHAIDHVQITVAETVGVNGRASYYDKYGALRDMVQNHLLQLVCLVGMEPPAYFNADQVRDEKLRVLRAIQPIAPSDVVRGQYEEGDVDGKAVASYRDELGGVSNTETYVALKLVIENWRWAGVPFYVRTGKRLTQRASEIVITFKNRPHDIFTKPGAPAKPDVPNRLTIRLQPHEGLRLQLTSKAPGPGGMRLFPSELNLSFGDTFDQRLPDAYERLLMDVARGNQTLFMRLDEVLAAWDIIDPLIADIDKHALHKYQAGTMGPMQGDTLALSDAHAWIDPHEGEA